MVGIDFERSRKAAVRRDDLQVHDKVVRPVSRTIARLPACSTKSRKLDGTVDSQVNLVGEG